VASFARTSPTDGEATRLKAVRAVGEALQARKSEVGSAMAKRIIEEIPSYRKGSPELLRDVRAGATATGALLAHAFAQGAELRREDVEVVRDVARQRVGQGVSLEMFQHAYRAALFAYWDACAREAVRLKISRDASLALARFALQAMDLVATQAAEAYVREEERLRTQSGRAARDLLEHLIAGHLPKSGTREAAAPGLDPTGQLIVIVARVEETALPAPDALQLTRETLEEAMSLGRARPLVAIRQSEVVLVAAAAASARREIAVRAARQRALDDHRTDVRYGVSGPAAGFPGIANAYREASLSLSHASAATPVVSLNDLPALECALIGADSRVKDMIVAKAGALTSMAPDDLSMTAATVRAFADADLNVARAAAGLHVHPNTLRYRLARIAELTAHDPRTFAGILELVCALRTIEDA
jgi:sugar diacid utilization regulator